MQRGTNGFGLQIGQLAIEGVAWSLSGGESLGRYRQTLYLPEMRYRLRLFSRTPENPRYIDGAGRAPPEDVGGIPGFELFLDAIADPKHEQHRELKRCHGRPFDPAHAAEDEIQSRMKKLARRRALGRAGFEKSRSQGS